MRKLAGWQRFLAPATTGPVARGSIRMYQLLLHHACNMLLTALNHKLWHGQHVEHDCTLGPKVDVDSSHCIVQLHRPVA